MKISRYKPHITRPETREPKPYWTNRKIVLCILAILSFLGAPILFKEYFKLWSDSHKTEAQKFDDQRWITIPRISAKFYNGGGLKVDFGGVLVMHRDFERYENEGWIMQAVPQFFCDSTDKSEPANHINLRWKNNQFLISLTLRDLKTGEIITKIEENEGKIDPKIIEPKFSGDGESYIEIIDKYDYVAFQMWVGEFNEIKIRGYFVGPGCVVFANDDTIKVLNRSDPDYEKKLVDYAYLLKRKFPKVAE